MKETKRIILGAGLSGLYAGYLLAQSGEDDFIIIEARDRIGGRIETFNQHFDLGPTWFWPEMQPSMAKLVASLGIETFNQYDEGSLLFEIDSSNPPRRTTGYHTSPQSKRFNGGVNQLLTKLIRQINNEKVFLNTIAKRIEIDNDQLIVTCQSNGDQQTQLFSAKQLLIALPPRLAIETLKFLPSLPNDIAQQWLNTGTWMASHAKYLATYERPFWRDSGLSGSAQSRLGPMVEIHDASTPGAEAALFGFIGIDAKTRHKMNSDQLTQLCRHQLVRLFGDSARNIKADHLKDWSKDLFTATSLDLDPSQGHSLAPTSMIMQGMWQDRIVGIGSEWSRQFPGYLAGSIDAVENALVKKKST